MTIEQLDGVVVVGAGPVGLVTAYMLARAGVPVTVLEAEAAVIESPRAITYHPCSLAVLERLGLLQEALAIGLAKTDYQFRTADGTILCRMDMSVLEGHSPYPYSLMLGQHLLADLILRRLIATPGATVRFEHRVTDVTTDAHGVTLQVSTADGVRSMRGPWVAATDGGRSTMRPALGLDFEGHTWDDRFVAVNLYYDFIAHGYARGTFVMDPDEWAVVPILSRDGMWRLTYGESDKLPLDTVQTRVHERLRALLPDPSQPYEVTLAAPYRLHQRAATSFRAGRVLLAGDCAHVTNPTGGLGLTSGLIDAEHLADALIAVLVDGADEHMLDDYAEARRQVFWNVTSPMATENKRRLGERDPERQREDRERLAKLNGDVAMQRQVLLATDRLASPPYPYRHDFTS